MVGILEGKRDEELGGYFEGRGVLAMVDDSTCGIMGVGCVVCIQLGRESCCDKLKWVSALFLHIFVSNPILT
jgi:hypothetical protein